MNELFLKEGNSIHTFKKGDIITRLKPSIKRETITNDNLGISTVVEKESDRSYLGDPMEFIGIFNNQIWVLPKAGISKLLSNRPRQLDLYEWSEGWALFELPEGYTIGDI